VSGYLDHQGEKFVQRFDTNSYLSITRTMDTFDPIRKYGIRAYERIQARVTLVGISSDWLFPASEVRSLAGELRSCGVDCNYCEIESSHGHDAFFSRAGQTRLHPGQQNVAGNRATGKNTLSSYPSVFPGDILLARMEASLSGSAKKASWPWEDSISQ